MELTYTTSAAKALRQLPNQDAAALEAKLSTFAADPDQQDGWVGALGGGAFRVRQGDYRAIVEIDQSGMTVVAVKAGNRTEMSK
jgi:mRNA-degrading endonuclease RelE of RelBE toxin-antitoxin system